MTYITLDLAKKLKKAGFDEKVSSCINEDGMVINFNYPKRIEYEKNYPYITIEEACQYMRNKHCVHIAVDFIKGKWVSTITDMNKDIKLPFIAKDASYNEVYFKALNHLCLYFIICHKSDTLI